MDKGKGRFLKYQVPTSGKFESIRLSFTEGIEHSSSSERRTRKKTPVVGFKPFAKYTEKALKTTVRNLRNKTRKGAEPAQPNQAASHQNSTVSPLHDTNNSNPEPETIAVTPKAQNSNSAGAEPAQPNQAASHQNSTVSPLHVTKTLNQESGPVTPEAQHKSSTTNPIGNVDSASI
jgi:hypothetical protein